MIKHFRTHTICLSGAIIFLWLEFPLPWLFGPLFSCLLAALIGINLYSIKILSDAMRTILGVAVGATVTLSFLLALRVLEYSDFYSNHSYPKRHNWCLVFSKIMRI